MTAAAPAIDIRRHMKWARSIARGVRRDYHLQSGSHEEQELEGAAYLALSQGAKRFNPEMVPDGGDANDLFRGWLARDVRTSCQREADRLRNGGTYHTTRNPTAAPAASAAVPDDDLATEVRRRSARPAREAGTALPLGGDDIAYRMLSAGLSIDGEIELPEWAEAVGRIATAANSMQWALGDLVLHGVELFGAAALDRLRSAGYAGESVRVATWVCKQFPRVARVTSLSFRHHQIVASLPLRHAKRLLRRAVHERLGTRALAALVREQRPAPVPDHARRLHTVAITLPRLDDVTRARLRDLASRHGVPFAGDQWPALDAVLAVLSGLKADRAA